ncbi:MAG: reverse transcriptase/maturase family protein [Patescibacteria group bacterium]
MDNKTSKFITIENLFFAWDEFKKGKQQKPDVLFFERNLEDNIFLLHEELTTKMYQHQGYRTFHVYDPKFRVINKATVRDRIVHHLVFRFLEPIFQPGFTHQSYSCQSGKGIHLGVDEVSCALRKVSRNDTQTVWALKLDIKKFFASVDHGILFSLLRKKVNEPDMLWLLEQIIESFHSPDIPGKGMPIGNLTSQIFANIYLSELDYFAKHTLREKYYFRYADDFLFLHPEREHLENILVIVEDFVEKKLQLTIHPNKIVFRKFNQGIDWVGYVLLPHYRVLRAKTKKRLFKKVLRKVELFNQGVLDDFSLEQTVQSYLGLLGHCSSYRIQQELQNEIWIRKENRLSITVPLAV